MKRPQLTVEKRTVLGKKVHKLRRDEGLLPANIYGKDLASITVQLPIKEFEVMYKEVGTSGLLDVVLDGTARPVLIHSVQFHPVTRMPQHADFYQVNMKEKVKTSVPLLAIGEAKAVADKIGLLMQPVAEIEVEALPADLPENIEVNVEALAAIGDQILVSDLKAPKGVDILTEPSQVAIKIDDIISEEAKKQAEDDAAAAVEAVAEKAEGEAANAEEVKEEAKEEKTEEKKE
ncbi:MAG: 50S ribosomal protein L25 [Candidatus Levybacteria bacterium]|nr:50S ribosomal protein L25 [Candidatus Levybacteria bacterium]